MREDFPEGVAVVTGGAGGLGRVIAGALAARGVSMATIDVVPAAGQHVSGAVPTVHVRADVADSEAVAAGVERIERELGPIAMLVCAAGVVSHHGLADLEPAEWRRIVDASLTGAYVCARTIVPRMAQRGGGAVVAISSGLATRGVPTAAHYAAAKAGTEALVKSVALEFAHDGVRANAVALGPFRTAMLDDTPGFDEAERAAAIPLGRIGEPDDAVGPVLFLLGDGSRYVTGQVLHVNGGFTLR